MNDEQNEFEVVEFRFIRTDDDCDIRFGCSNIRGDQPIWSRPYEYTLVLNTIGKFFSGREEPILVHNSSWGWEGVHVMFKQELERLYSVENSDIKKSSLPNTFVRDITNPPDEDMVDKYDVVINVSTVEEISHTPHTSILNNLISQVKPEGLLICTFDIPGLDIIETERLLGQKIKDTGERLDGKNSKVKNTNYAHLNCGLLVLRKMGH